MKQIYGKNTDSRIVRPGYQNLVIYLDYLIDSSSDNEHQSYICSENLKFISIKLDLIRFSVLEEIVKHLFDNVEVLKLSTKYESSYINANRWQQLVSCYMPKLRIFDNSTKKIFC
jgi:hypothetical protein